MAVQNPLGFPPGGIASALNVLGSSVVKPNSGRIFSVIVNRPGTSAGGVYDTTSIATANESNLIAAIPIGFTGPLNLSVLCKQGIVYLAGADMISSFSYS